MTLFKQMAIALSLLIIIILASVMTLNYQTAKRGMVESLYQVTVNNIASLSSTLQSSANKNSQEDKTPAVVKSIIDAAFDSGYYRLIEFQTDTYRYRQIDEDKIDGVPEWFVSLSHIEIEPITTEVLHNWITMGKLTVIGDVAPTYRALYAIFTNLIYLFIIISFISLVLLNIMLHFILKSLKNVKHQAEAILNNEFIIEKELPYTVEFRDVSNAMNSMVHRVQEIFRQAAESAKRNKELQYNDPITKLFNRRYLMIKLPELIVLEGKTEGGSIMLMALEGAEHINQLLGRQKADELFFAFAQILKDATHLHDDSLAARVNGTEFVIVLPNADKEESLNMAQKIRGRFARLLEEFDIDQTQSTLNIGIYRYHTKANVSELLTKVDTALLHAKNDTQDHIHLYEDEYEQNPLTKTEWRDLLERSIKSNNFAFEFYPVKDIKTGALIHKLISFEIIAEDDKSYSYNALIAPAINLGLTSELFLGVLKLLFTKYDAQLKEEYYSLKLPKEFLEDANSFEKLSQLFHKYAKKVHLNLCFEVADNFAAHKTATVLGYVDLFKKYGLSIGIHSYTASANEFSYLREINPKFIKADAQFLLDQSQDAINNLQVITNSLGIEIIAVNVNDVKEKMMLQKYNISKFQETNIDSI